MNIIKTAGLCWSAPNRNGRCTDLLRTEATKEECCNGVDSANYGIATTAYSPEELNSGQLFYFRALRGGVPCSPCKGIVIVIILSKVKT
jgi:follistatin